MKMKRAITATAAPSQTATDVLAALDRKLNSWVARKDEIVRQQLELEESGVVPIEPGKSYSVDRDAISWVKGSKLPDLVGETPGERLHALLRERRALERALELLVSPHNQARITRAAEVLVEGGDKWRAIMRERIELLLKLRAVNAKAFAFKADAQLRAPDLLFWPGDHGGDLFSPELSPDAQEFLDRCASEGFATAKEVSR